VDRIQLIIAGNGVLRTLPGTVVREDYAGQADRISKKHNAVLSVLRLLFRQTATKGHAAWSTYR